MTHKHTRVTHIIYEIIYYYLMYTIDDKDVILLLCAGNTGQQWHVVEMLQQRCIAKPKVILNREYV